MCEDRHGLRGVRDSHRPKGRPSEEVTIQSSQWSINRTLILAALFVLNQTNESFSHILISLCGEVCGCVWLISIILFDHLVIVIGSQIVFLLVVFLFHIVIPHCLIIVICMASRLEGIVFFFVFLDTSVFQIGCSPLSSPLPNA